MSEKLKLWKSLRIITVVGCTTDVCTGLDKTSIGLADCDDDDADDGGNDCDDDAWAEAVCEGTNATAAAAAGAIVLEDSYCNNFKWCVWTSLILLRYFCGGFCEICKGR